MIFLDSCIMLNLIQNEQVFQMKAIAILGRPKSISASVASNEALWWKLFFDDRSP